MKTTMVKLRKKIMNVSGAKLDKSYPFWMKQQQVKLIENAMEAVIQMGNEEPEKQYTATEKQVERLSCWVQKIKDEYLLGI